MALLGGHYAPDHRVVHGKQHHLVLQMQHYLQVWQLLEIHLVHFFLHLGQSQFQAIGRLEHQIHLAPLFRLQGEVQECLLLGVELYNFQA